MKAVQKRLLSLLLIVFISSNLYCAFCGYSVIADEDIEKKESELDNEKEDLLYGYNVASGISLMQHDAISKRHPIIDPKSDYKDHIVISEKREQTAFNCEGSNLRELEKQYCEQSAFNCFGKVFIADLNLGGLFNKSVSTKEVYSEYYELYYTRIIRGTTQVQLDRNQIREKYLSDDFKRDLNSIASISDAKRLYEKYGTHLSTGYIYGGILDITNYKTTADTEADLSKYLLMLM